jgi:hypothetical protein
LQRNVAALPQQLNFLAGNIPIPNNQHGRLQRTFLQR